MFPCERIAPNECKELAGHTCWATRAFCDHLRVCISSLQEQTGDVFLNSALNAKLITFFTAYQYRKEIRHFYWQRCSEEMHYNCNLASTFSFTDQVGVQLKPQTRIQEVLGSNTCQNTAYPDREFLYASILASRQITGCYFNQVMRVSFHTPSNSSVICYHTILRRIIKLLTGAHH